MKSILPLLLAAFIPIAILRADDKPAADSAETASEPLNAADVAVLRAHEGQEKTVRGKVIRTKDWDGGPQKKAPKNFIDFEGGHFGLVVFAEDYPKFKDGMPAKIYANKTLEVTGKIEPWQGNYQIKLRDPSQVKIVGDAKSNDKKSDDRKDDKRKERDKEKEKDKKKDK